MDRRWVPLAEISPRLAEAVIAAEDNLFCRHHGFDWESLGEVIAEYEPGEPSRGASTITMPTATNLSLWPARSKTGRAACRERVGLYVESLVVAVSLKKKQRSDRYKIEKIRKK